MYSFLSKELKNGQWRCLYCEKLHQTQDEVFSCLTEHELVLVPFSKQDLNRLYMFLHRKDEDLLTKSLVKVISRYHRNMRKTE